MTNRAVPARVPRLATVTRDEARALASDHVLVFVLGSTEQHGGHLPLSTDTLGVEAVLGRALAELGGSIPLVIAPSMPFGSSAHHLAHPGTLSLGTETYLAAIKDLLRSAVSGGFRRAFILNGHGGNHELAELAARDLALDDPIDVGVGSWWTIGAQPLADLGVPNAGHSGVFETCVMLRAYPDLVRQPIAPHDPGPRQVPLTSTYRLERHGFWAAIDGITDDPSRADAARGEAYLDAAGRAVAEALRGFVEWTTVPIARRGPTADRQGE
jgi:creatinine amidohydrolase